MTNKINSSVWHSDAELWRASENAAAAADCFGCLKNIPVKLNGISNITTVKAIPFGFSYSMKRSEYNMLLGACFRLQTVKFMMEFLWRICHRLLKFVHALATAIGFDLISSHLHLLSLSLSFNPYLYTLSPLTLIGITIFYYYYYFYSMCCHN